MSEPYVAEIGEEVVYYPFFNQKYPWSGKVVSVHSIRTIGQGEFFAPGTRFCQVDIEVPNPDGSTSLVKNVRFEAITGDNTCRSTRKNETLSNS